MFVGHESHCEHVAERKPLTLSVQKHRILFTLPSSVPDLTSFEFEKILNLIRKRNMVFKAFDCSFCHCAVVGDE